MSTGLEVRRLVLAKQLFELPVKSNGSKYRVVALDPKLEQAFMGPWQPGSNDELIMPRFKQQLDNFILGGRVGATFRAEPKVELRRLQLPLGIKKKVVWEFRFAPKKRQDHLRLLGCFAEANYFVGLTLKSRTGLNFGAAILETHSAWSSFLPNNDPVESEIIDDFIRQPFTFFS